MTAIAVIAVTMLAVGLAVTAWACCMAAGRADRYSESMGYTTKV